MRQLDVKKLTILGGTDKNKQPEKIDALHINQGDAISVVGATGSGKTSLIIDVEQIAQRDTFTQRRVLINDAVPDESLRRDSDKKIVAQLSQSMRFFANMQVEEFIRLHARCRNKSEVCLDQVLEAANLLTGEPITASMDLTILSGGQSRALMVADIAIISDSPIVLIDEIENAGIQKEAAINLLSGSGKIIILITHDPVIALMTPMRLVMHNGSMTKLLKVTAQEMEIATKLQRMDRAMQNAREEIRKGLILSKIAFGEWCI